MLPDYIIDEILKRLKRKRSSQEKYIEYPELENPFERYPYEIEEEESDDRGIAIIDFNI